jgi:NAD+ diphosphatase
MIHEIAPHIYDNSFSPISPRPTDYIYWSKGREILFQEDGDDLRLPMVQELPPLPHDPTYLFRIDDHAFFVMEQAPLPEGEGLVTGGPDAFRQMSSHWMSFGGATASQLARWRGNHRFCGRCGSPMEDSTTERALCCPNCHLIEYPKIAPAIIVAIRNGDKLLMARNARSTFRRFSVIAGFVEIGESFEDTVRREAMEEVGVRVKNIHYYKSQPWAFGDNEMVGFVADLDGSDQLTFNDGEIAEARWFSREEIPQPMNLDSIGGELIEAFRTGRI